MGKMADDDVRNAIDAHIAQFPPATQEKLEALRALIKSVVPEATELISYRMPTFDLNGRHLVHFAGWKNHIGFYPGSGTATEAFAEELAPYKTSKGSVQFPLDQPLPEDLIRRMIEFRIRENAAKAAN